MSVCTENLDSDVVVMKSEGSDFEDGSGPLNWPPDLRIFVQRPMCPEFIVQHDDGTPTRSQSTSFFFTCTV